MPSKSGRHHNRNGLRQIKNGSLARKTKRLAKRLGIPYRNPTKDALDLALPPGHNGSSLECMHPFCVAERNTPSQ